MKTSILLLSLLTSTFAASQLSPPSFPKPAANYKGRQQAPIMNIPNIALPPSDKDDPSSNPSGEVIISDVIGKERVINIFAGFTRDIETISKRLDDNT
ncbi:MAG: Transcriptional regulatory protein sin3, partial [Pleopsidium flavum]